MDGSVRKANFTVKKANIDDIGPLSLSEIKCLHDSKVVNGDDLVFNLIDKSEDKVANIATNVVEHATIDSSFWFFSDVFVKDTLDRIKTIFMSRNYGNNKLIKRKSSVSDNFIKYCTFEQFLESEFTISNFVKLCNLNKLSQPFAQWLFEIFNIYDIYIDRLEFLELLLSPEPEFARNFFEKKFKEKEVSSYMFSQYNRWRLCIPIYLERDSKYYKHFNNKVLNA